MIEPNGIASEAECEISICIVIFKPDRVVLERTVVSLRNALARLSPRLARLYIVDNSAELSDHDWLREMLRGLTYEIIAGHGNVGFGSANNMVLDRIGKFHLVLNPDVEMEPEALEHGLAFMLDNPDCGLSTPEAFNPDGSKQYLCKRYPAVFDLLLRGFAPSWVRDYFCDRLQRYEMRDQAADIVGWDPPIVSGCFMLFRGDVFRKLNGFDPRYFLYFEDFDVSLRTGKVSRIAYVPAIRIVHGGGNAARKGPWHIWQFARSAAIFYSTYPLKFF